jgi:KUP system potassium uptake protein
MSPEASRFNKQPAALLPTTLAALGVVYGDIGTSPLYALRECFHGPHAIELSRGNVLGVLSLILWSLIIVISIKYLVYVLSADNEGEGGILALMALALKSNSERPHKNRYFVPIVTTLGLFGSALLYGDGVITPAISVLSAIEGLNFATPLFEPYILLITVAIIIVLFLLQKNGTARIGKAFGPIILLWFFTLALLGIKGIISEPSVASAVLPYYALAFLLNNSLEGFIVLGSVFLVVTGGEALYADLGHFGKRAIRTGWFFVALPSLVIHYFGQGALLLHDPSAVENPFYLLAPTWAVYPLVVLAAAATVIASQAVITGVFSLSQQAVQLGFFPRIAVKHTSEQTIGQIYVPAANWALFIGTILLVLTFKSSSALAAAYGIAVTTTMIVTTILTYVVMRSNWGWPMWRALLPCVLFLVLDFAFFSANSLKILDGGWLPLLLALVVFTLMVTWKRGRKMVADKLTTHLLPLDQFIHDSLATIHSRTPGTAVFMTASAHGTPAALIKNTLANKVLHETLAILTVSTESVPYVAPHARLEVLPRGNGFYRIFAHYGFMESPDVPRLLELCRGYGLPIALGSTTFFLGRETLLATPGLGMALWREKLFTFMARNAYRATDYFHIPSQYAIEIGTVLEI